MSHIFRDGYIDYVVAAFNDKYGLKVNVSDFWPGGRAVPEPSTFIATVAASASVLLRRSRRTR